MILLLSLDITSIARGKGGMGRGCHKLGGTEIDLILKNYLAHLGKGEKFILVHEYINVCGQQCEEERRRAL